MDELVEQIVTATGVDSAAAGRAVGIILGFISREAPPTTVRPLLDKLPGAEALAAENHGSGGGLLGVFNDLAGAGLGMSEIQSVVMAFVAAAKAKAGDREVNAVVGAIPGLSQFI